jgi:hypothetical protein
MNRIDRNTRRALERELKDLPTTPPPADLLDRIRQEIPATPGASNADDGPAGAGAPRRPRAARWLSLAAMLAVGALGATLAYRVSRDSGGTESLVLRPSSAPAPQAAPTVRSSEALATGETVENEVGGSKDEDVLLKEETDDQALAGRRRVGDGGEAEAKTAPLPDPAPQPLRVQPPSESADRRSGAASRFDGIAMHNEQAEVETEALLKLKAEQQLIRRRLEEQRAPAPSAPATEAPAGAPSQGASRLGRLEEPRRQMTGAEDAEKSRRDAAVGVVSESEAVARRAPRPEPEPVPSPVPPADMYFRDAGTNPFVDAREDRLSTFALDVDTGAWTLARSYLERGMLPPREAIRVEEFVNAQAYDDPAPRRGEFTLTAEGAPSPFVPDERYRLLRFAVKAREVDSSERKPANLTFVIDVSGSMDRENRLGLVQRALGLLLDELDPDDRVGLVV